MRAHEHLPKWNRDRPFAMHLTKYRDCWQGYVKHPDAFEPLYSRADTREEAASLLVQGMARLGWLLPLWEMTADRSDQDALHA